MTYKLFPTALLLLFFSSLSWAQKTGSFQEDITFNSESRTLACFVPNDYEPNTTYNLMIGLHGLGASGTNYRNALINSAGLDDIFKTTIFICPDGGSDQNKDFYTPEGDEAIIEEAIKWAVDHYEINEDAIILQGFSLGGRSALKYGLEHTDRFSGLFLATPAVQGLLDADNAPEVGFGFAYQNASQIPIAITLGLDDLVYISSVEKTVNHLVENNAQLQYRFIKNMGHTLPNKVVTSQLAGFLKQPISTQLDVELRDLKSKDLHCTEWVSSNCLVRNTGSETINSIRISYGTTNLSQEYTWTGSLAPYQHANITLPDFESAVDGQLLKAQITSINNETDSIADNNADSTEIFVSNTGLQLPYTEDFEGDVIDWTLESTGSLFEWYLDNTVGKSGGQSMSTFNTIWVFTTLNEVETFNSPVLDLSSLEAPSMSFDVAYSYHKFTPPYFTQETILADTLIVSISSDCGANIQVLFKKGGEELITASNPIENPLNVNSSFFTPTEQEWQNIAIGLQEFGELENAVISFSYKSVMGGNIYIDNVAFGDYLSVDEQAQALDIDIYPNPNNGRFTIKSEKALKRVNIYDSKGELVLSEQNPNANQEYSLEAFENGIYLIQLFDGENTYTKRVSVNK